MIVKYNLCFTFHRFLTIILLLGVCNAAPYVPGEPGGPWTESELSIVKAKLYAVYSRSDEMMELLNLEDIDKMPGRPNAPKMVRLGFHDCLKLVTILYHIL